jgi:hypothetical protein
MVSKCVNPYCAAPFRYLDQGRLFRLENDVPVKSREPAEYFWLCSACSRTMTLCLSEDRGIAIAPFKAPAERAAERVDFILLDRQRGLLLTSLVGALHFKGAS